MRARSGLAIAAALSIASAAGVVGAVSTTRDRGLLTADTASASQPLNPLDPLSADEIQTTFTVIEHAKSLADGTFFPVVKLSEPPKSDVLAWSPGQPFARKALRQRLRPRREQAVRGGRRPQVEAAHLMDAQAGRPAGRLRHRVGRRRRPRPCLCAVEEGDARPRHRPQGRLRGRVGAGRPARPRSAGRHASAARHRVLPRLVAQSLRPSDRRRRRHDRHEPGEGRRPRGHGHQARQHDHLGQLGHAANRPSSR